LDYQEELGILPFPKGGHIALLLAKSLSTAHSPNKILKQSDYNYDCKDSEQEQGDDKQTE
jgi:hypothetical protein